MLLVGWFLMKQKDSKVFSSPLVLGPVQVAVVLCLLEVVFFVPAVVVLLACHEVCHMRLCEAQCG